MPSGLLSFDFIGLFIACMFFLVYVFKKNKVIGLTTLFLVLLYSFSIMCLVIVADYEDLLFVVRCALILFDAIALYVLTSRFGLTARQTLISITVGFLIAYLTWTTNPQLTFYFSSPKSWAAVLPLLLFPLLTDVDHNRRLVITLSFSLLVLIPIVILYETRALAIGIAVYLTFVFLRNAKLAVFFIPLVIVCLIAVSDFITTVLMQDQFHSNFVRSTMILEGFNVSMKEFFLGSGIDAWREKISISLGSTVNISTFLETSNPHFFPIELFIRTGILLIVPILITIAKYYKGISSFAYPLGLLTATFFTTNTGVERIVFSVAIFLLIYSYRSNKHARSKLVSVD